MSRQEIMDITADAIRVVLGDKKLEITEDTYLIDELGFNSLDVMEMIGELEESFGCTIDGDDLEQFAQVRDIVEYIVKM